MLRTLAITLLVLLACAFATSFAATGMVELLNPTGARQAGMGETAPLAAPDPYNLEYNPASINGIPKGIFGFSHNSFFLNRYTNSVSVIFPVKGVTCGVHMRLSTIGDIEARDNVPTTEPLYLFSSHDFSAKIFGAYSITPKLYAALTAGAVIEKIDIHRSGTPVFGLGLLYKFDYGLSFHGSLANLGPKYKFIDEEQDAPAIYRAGASFHKDIFTVNSDYVNIKNGESHVHFGGEALLQNTLFLRTGYITGYDNRNFTAGLGIIYKDFRIDYAFIPYTSDLGTSHRISFIYSLR